MKVYYAAPRDRPPPLPSFINSLEPKFQSKLYGYFDLMEKHPLPREPIVKHFTIEKYSRLYELRAKSKIMVRVIFTVLDSGDILLLTPFIKKHKRTYHAGA